MDDSPIWSDLAIFDGKPWRGVVDWLIGGIPCQPHSTAGQRRGDSDERDLWPDTARIIGEVRPGAVFLENVPGILRYYHERIGPDLRAMGYATEEGLFSAAEVGAPHVRQWFFVLAHTSNHRLGGWHQRGASDEADQVGTAGSVSSLAHAERWAGEALSDTISERHKGIRWPEQGITQQDIRTVFPPSPVYLDGWARVLTEMPSLEPAVCNLAYGLASNSDRSHRLRLLGNGVVPLVAAHALRTLLHRAGLAS